MEPCTPLSGLDASGSSTRLPDPFGLRGVLPPCSWLLHRLPERLCLTVLSFFLLSGRNPQNPSEGQRKPGGNAPLSSVIESPIGAWGMGAGQERTSFEK